MIRANSFDRVNLLWCSNKRVDSNWYVDEHCHLYQQIIFVNDGLLHIGVDGEHAKLSKGQCAFIDSSKRHWLRPCGPCDLTEVKFIVHDKALLEAVSSIPPFCLSPPSSIRPALDRLVAEGKEQRAYFQRIVAASLEMLLYDLARGEGDGDIGGENHVGGLATSTESFGKDSPDLILKVIQHFEKHYADDISLESLGRELGYNPTYLCERFSAVVGCPPIRYLTEYRIQAAKDLLKTTSLPVSDVSWSVGYRSTSHFSRVFRSIVGQSPKQYRNAARERDNFECFFVAKSVLSRYGISPDSTLDRTVWAYG